MSLPQQTSIHRASPTTTECYLPAHLNFRRSNSLQELNRSIRCNVGSPATGHLSYPLTELRSASQNSGAMFKSNSSTTGGNGAAGSHAWLPACVRHIVTVLGQQGRSPMLQLVFSSRGGGSSCMQHRFEAIPISQSVADNPQRWAEFASRVRSSSANGLVLVRPIASPDQHCAFAAAATSVAEAAPSPSGQSSTCTPTYDTDTCINVQEGATVTPSSPGAIAALDDDMLAGRVGSCCDSNFDIMPGDANTAPSTSGVAQQGQHLQPSRLSAASAASLAAMVPSSRTDAAPSGPICDAGPTQYYGLVVQGSCISDADGCWVLKTTRSDSPGAHGLCSCTHFSLTRVCQGQPLYTQLRDAWLVR
ncbi:hypothetical protein Vretimale_14653 [Volvox reticuliferus]|uniref:Uncharacterized protein n=1 Tax=Volvox reticuliferus TaxID=1737510 RepID=A0A8J4GQ46_9CHLO|nr:hypothetical protein Vretifemale_15741 [Volvox reticuliferus]GIM11090.1 hypothetical protein Vretimale_14653 [Volvox reticuliferus]